MTFATTCLHYGIITVERVHRLSLCIRLVVERTANHAVSLIIRVYYNGPNWFLAIPNIYITIALDETVILGVLN